MKRSLFTLAAVLMCGLCAALTASASPLPLPWRADWPNCKPVEKLLHRGVDVALRPTWYVNGIAADTNGWNLTTYVQTNAVGAWFGPLPGAFFSHTNDVGAAFYSVMVRAETPGGNVNYTAFARFRMLDSPGFTPGELPLPAKVIDFADVTVLNPPWGDVDFSPGNTQLVATIEAVAPAPGNYAVVSNAAMNAVVTNALQDAALALRPTKAQLDAGWWSEWTISPDDGTTVEWGGEYWYFVINQDQWPASGGNVENEDATYLEYNEVFGNYTATRHRVAAPVPTKPEDIGAASTADATLTPVYSQTPTYSKWTILRDGVNVTSQVSQPTWDAEEGPSGAWQVGGSYVSGDNIDAITASGTSDSLSLSWISFDGHYYTATRTRTDIVGYTLGSQTNKVLSSTNDLARASDLAAVRSVADAAATTNAAQSAALASQASQLSQLSQAIAAIGPAATNYTDSAIADADTSYRRVAFLTNLNQSAQYVSVTDTEPTTLTIDLPAGTNTADWIVYVTSVTNVSLSLPTATWYMADEAYTNDIPPATPTALYFTQMADGLYMLGRQELKPITIVR